MDEKYYSVYIMTNKNNRVLYTGVTNNIQRRVFEHKQALTKGFTQQYNANKLVYLEQTPDINAAITREKQIKSWKRQKKLDLISANNPQWKDLSQW